MLYATFGSRRCVINFKDYMEGLNFSVPIIELNGSVLLLWCELTNIKSNYLHIGRNSDVNGYNVDIETYVLTNDTESKRRVSIKKNVFIGKPDMELGELLDNIIFQDINFLSLYNSLLMGELKTVEKI